VFGRLTALPPRERVLHVRVASTRLLVSLSHVCLLFRSSVFILTTREEPNMLFMRTDVFESRMKSHQAIHAVMFLFVQLFHFPQSTSLAPQAR
jgi:hypothetical protein